MKQILTLLIILKTLTSFGQVFITDSKKWNDLYAFYATCNCSMHETHSYFTNGDSIINDISYKVLYDSTFRATSYSSEIIELTIKGFIRESNSGKEIYYIENGTTKETKIYDFGFNTDSTLTIGLYTYTVHSTDSIDVLGEKRKILYLSDAGVNGLFWISGIGSNRGLFYSQYQDALLLCVKDNNKLIYKNDENYDCVFYDFVSSIDDIKTSTIDVYPNPTKDKFVIKSNKLIESIDIFNSLGKLIMSVSPNMTEFIVNLDKHDKGLYIVRIDNETIKLIKE